MSFTFQDMEAFAERVAEKAVQKYIDALPKKEYKSKSEMALDLKCDRKTITAMIERCEIIITPSKRYKLK